MLRQNEKAAIQMTPYAAIILFTTIVICSGCRKQPVEEIQPVQYPATPAEPSTNTTTTSSKKTINDIIRAAGGWRPAHLSWLGKHAPDFTLADVHGKLHKLSDYRGKNVMIIFWATWCPPCRIEIPHLIELRRTISEDNLAMLAITNEKPEKIKEFVSRNGMNYTVLLEKDDMPKPFGLMRVYRTSGVPCSFFIDPDGRIKLATAGLMPLDDIKAVLKAEPGY